MYECLFYFVSYFPAVLAVIVIIVLEHLFCYKRRLTPVVRYTLGVLAFAVPYSFAVQDIRAVTLLWWCIGAAGITTIVLHVWRMQRHEHHGEHDSQYRAGRITALATSEESNRGEAGGR